MTCDITIPEEFAGNYLHQLFLSCFIRPNNIVTRRSSGMYELIAMLLWMHHGQIRHHLEPFVRMYLHPIVAVFVRAAQMHQDRISGL